MRVLQSDIRTNLVQWGSRGGGEIYLERDVVSDVDDGQEDQQAG